MFNAGDIVMQLTPNTFLQNSIESVSFASQFSNKKVIESEADSSTMSLQGMIVITSSTTFEPMKNEQVQCDFLITPPDNSMQELWFTLSEYNRKKTSWTPSKDKVDEIRALAIKSLYHSMDIGIDLSGNLLNFCYRHKLMEHVKTSIALIKKCFPSYENISAEFVEDMESDEQWILINVFVRDKIDRILDMYDKYTEEWIDKVPWPESSKIRISYHPIK